jgi:hypothetical protein
MFDLDHYDPPSYGGTPTQEANEEMRQIFGMENPDKQWILTDFDSWERNPFYSGPEQQHPEDSTPPELWTPYVAPTPEPPSDEPINEDEIPF